MTLGRITMSGACYELAARPAVEGGELEEPERRKVGRGWQASWPFSQDLLEYLFERVATYYVSTEGWGDDDTARDRSVMKRWLDQYRNHVPRSLW